MTVSALFLYQYVGIALYDQNNAVILEEDWNFYAYYYWLDPQEIPAGQHIIGFKCSSKSKDHLKSLGILLGKKG